MKKIIVTLTLILTLLMSLTSCSFLNEGDEDVVNQSICEKLDSLVNITYKQVDLGIVTVTDGIQLSSNYVLTGSKVNYSVEKLNLLPSDGNLADVPSEYKTTYTGTALIVDGKVYAVDGKVVSLPSYDELSGKFNFAADNFSNVASDGTSFTADVVSPSGFFGSLVNAENVKVSVTFTETALTKITITYNTANSTVTTTYEFTA